MISHAPLSLLFVSGVAAGTMWLASCREAPPAPPAGKSAFPSPKKIDTSGADGLARLVGQTDPYTGPVVLADKNGAMRYYAYYQDGRLHGAEVKFYDDGTIRRQFDYHLGEKIHHREWFPNGNRKIDAEMRDGVGYGSHRTWFEDGRERWKGRFGDHLLWEGRIVDYSEDGQLMWDAVFSKGLYQSGHYPESEQEKLIAGGLLKPEQAKYPRPAAAAHQSAAP